MNINVFISNIILKRLKQIYNYDTNEHTFIKVDSYLKRSKYEPIILSDIISVCIYDKENILQSIIYIFYNSSNYDIYIESGYDFNNLKKQKIENIISKKNIENELEIVFWFYNEKKLDWHNILDNNLKKKQKLNISNNLNNELLLNNILSGPYYNIYYKLFEKNLDQYNGKVYTFKEILKFIETQYLTKKIKLGYNQKLAVVKTNKGWSL